MFNLSGSELVFLVLIALVVLGPDKLPEAMRKAGKAYADFKKMTTGFQTEMKSVLDEPMRELRETAELAKSSAMFDVNGFTDSVKDLGATVTGKTPPAKQAATATSMKPVSGSMADQTPSAAAPVADAPAADVLSTEAPVAAVLASVDTDATPDQPVDDATARRLARATPPDLNVSTMNLTFDSAGPTNATAPTPTPSAEALQGEVAGASRVISRAAVAGGSMQAGPAAVPPPSPAPTDDVIASAGHDDAPTPAPAGGPSGDDHSSDEVPA